MEGFMPRHILVLLKDEKFSVGENATYTSSCTEAWDLFGKENFDCVVLDYSLPDCESLDLVAKIRNLDPKVPIVIAGNGNESIAVKMFKAGVNDYIPKEELTEDRVSSSICSVVQQRRDWEEVQQAKEKEIEFLDTIHCQIKQRISNYDNN